MIKTPGRTLMEQHGPGGGWGLVQEAHHDKLRLLWQ